jgi:hypothetical protein
MFEVMVNRFIFPVTEVTQLLSKKNKDFLNIAGILMGG